MRPTSPQPHACEHRLRRLELLLAAVVVLWSVSPSTAQISAPAPPDDPASARFTLDHIYQRLIAGIPGTKRGAGFVEPTGPPGPTGPNLDEILAVAPFPDDANGATPAQCLAGRSFWSLATPFWGPRVGGIPNLGGVVLDPGAMDVSIPVGYHDGSGIVRGDPLLVPGNVRSGITLFGVDGDPNVVDTSSGDAVAGDLADGRRAWVDGAEVVGSYVPPVAPLRFQDNGDGTVTDNRTGLVWLRDASCPDLPSTDASGRATNAGLAITAANGLTSGLCGLTDGSAAGDWRLPHAGQLWSLVDPRYGFPGPSITNAAGTTQLTAGDPFVGVELTLLDCSFGPCVPVPRFYWTSTIEDCPAASFQICAVGVTFAGGGLLGELGGSLFVWPFKDCAGANPPASCP